jgi:hypothetical protein
VREKENNILDALARAGTVAGRPTRIGETNSVSCRSSADPSPPFAGALWSLDWVLRAVSSGASGLNFHGGLGVCLSHSESPFCAPSSEAARAGDITAQPEYYGMLAASRLEGGRFVPTSLTAPGPLPNLTSWATLAPGGTVRIAIDNLATEGAAQPVSIHMSGYTVTEEPLTAPSAEANSGIALGGAAVTSVGQWQTKPARPFHTRRSVRVIVSPASAVIVTLRPMRSRG